MKDDRIRELADQVISGLSGKGIIIQRYNAYSTCSVYLKFDYGVCNSLRISDHPGKEKLCYRYNLIIGHEKTIEEEKYMRYYFNEHTVTDLVNMILFDRMAKIQKYGIKNYRSYMDRELSENKNAKGFWSNAKLVDDGKNNAGQDGMDMVYARQVMPDGVTAFGPAGVLDMYRQSVYNQQELDNNSKFRPGMKVKLWIPFEALVRFYCKQGKETPMNARKLAMEVVSPDGGYETGEVIGNTVCDDGRKYCTVSFPLSPMTFLPEDFFEQVN